MEVPPKRETPPPAPERIPSLPRAQSGDVLAFVGRQRELELLREAWSAARRSATVIWLHGPSGVGKTALARRFSTELPSANDALVLAGRCYQRESSPYKGWDEILESLVARAQTWPTEDWGALVDDDSLLLGRLFPVMRKIEILRGERDWDEQIPDAWMRRRRAFAALRAFLRRVAERHPLLIALDDMQWADPDGLRLLEALVAPPDPPAILVLITARSTPDDLGLRRDLPWRAVELTPLTDADSRSLLSHQLTQLGAPPGIDVDRLVHHAAGNPYVIDELARAAATQSAAIEADSAFRLGDAIWRRLDRLPADERDVAELVAASNRPLTRAVVQTATLLRPSSLERHLVDLGSIDLVRGRGGAVGGRWEPYHERTRQAIMDRQDHESLRRLHSRLADAIEQHDTARNHPAALLVHLEAAGEERRAARIAREAGDRALAALAFDRACALYRTGLRLGVTLPRQELHELQRRWAEALICAGRGNTAASVLLMIAGRASSDAQALRYRRRAAQQLLASGQIEHGIELLQEALVASGERFPETPRQARRDLIRQRLWLRLRGLRWRERQEAAIDPELLAQVDLFGGAALGLALVDAVRGALFHTRSLRLALRAGERRRALRALALECGFLALSGPRGRRRAHRLLESVRRQVAAADDSYLQFLVAGVDAMLAFSDGDFTRAIEHAQAAEEGFVGQVDNAWSELHTARSIRLFSLRHLGRLGELHRSYLAYRRDAEERGDRLTDATYRRYCAVSWLATDEPEQARAEMDAAPWSPPEHRYDIRRWFDAWSQAELALYEDDGTGIDMEHFRPELDRLRAAPLYRATESIRLEADWLWGRLALAAAGPDRALREAALDEAQAAAARLSRSPLANALVWSSLLRAGLAARRADAAASVAPLRTAIAEADRRGMIACAAVARRRLALVVEGDEATTLTDEANASFRRIGPAVDPQRLCHLYAPGWND